MGTFKKTSEQLTAELKEQVEELRDRCAAYDAGKNWEAKSLASSAYKLLHDGTGRTKSLLGMLDLKSKVGWTSTARPMSETILPNLPLTVMNLSADGCHYEPMCVVGGSPFPSRELPFSRWWQEPVYRTLRGLELSRKNIVFTMRTQDGGGHVDDHIRDEAYHWLATEADERIGFRDGGLEIAFDGGTSSGNRLGAAHRPTMRQIAWEIDETLKRLAL